MGITEDLADDLAQQVIKLIEASGDDQIISEVVKVLGATSQTAEEAFLTSLRVRRANIAAHALILKHARALKAQKSINDAAQKD